MTFDLLSSVYKKGRASLFIVRLILLSLCPLFSLVGVILSLVFLNRSNKVALSVLLGICLFLFLSSLFFILVSILGPEIKERKLLLSLSSSEDTSFFDVRVRVSDEQVIRGGVALLVVSLSNEGNALCLPSIKKSIDGHTFLEISIRDSIIVSGEEKV